MATSRARLPDPNHVLLNTSPSGVTTPRPVAQQYILTSDNYEVKGTTMRITSSSLIRWTGLCAMAGGIIFAGIQPIHPPDVVSSIGTGVWTTITYLKTAMCLLMLVGLMGIYARQMNKTGWLALIGFVVFGLAWALTYGDVFAETFILPPLVTAAPTYVDSFLGVPAGRTTPVNLGVFPTVFALASGFYLLGGLLFGIATFRARVLPRWASGLLATTALLTPAVVILPHQFQRLAAIPMGIAMAGLGYALWTERRQHASSSSVEVGASQLLTVAE